MTARVGFIRRVKRRLAEVQICGTAWIAFQDGHPNVAVEIWKMADFMRRDPEGFISRALQRPHLLPVGFKAPG